MRFFKRTGNVIPMPRIIAAEVQAAQCEREQRRIDVRALIQAVEIQQTSVARAKVAEIVDLFQRELLHFTAQLPSAEPWGPEVRAALQRWMEQQSMAVRDVCAADELLESLTATPTDDVSGE